MTEPTTALVIQSDASTIGPVLPVVTPEAMADAMRLYEAMKKSVLSELDEQEITIKGKKRKFIKRSGWRRLSIAFGVSTTILDHKVISGSDGRTVSSEFTVRATAPNGRFADGWGACSAWEERFQDERGRLKMEHDIPATAETRAENRASSNLFGYGEMSAEEIEDSPGVDKPTCPKCGKVVRESTFVEGEWFCWTKQGGCGWKGSEPVRTDGEISLQQASAQTQAAFRNATATPSGEVSPAITHGAGAGERPGTEAVLDSPPLTAAIQESVPAKTSPPPQTAGGPRAKRGNVVAAPAPAAVAPPVTAQVTLEEPLEGQEQYLDELRRQARQAAAVIRHLQVKRENLLHAEEIKLGNRQAAKLPSLAPNLEADDSLRQFVEKRYPGKRLVGLGETELDGSDDAPGILRALQSIIDALHAKGFHE